MKLLVLTPQLPYPPHQGTTIRNFNILRYLSSHHQVTLLSFGTEEELAGAEPLCSVSRRIEIAPYPTRSMAQRALSTISSPLPDMALRLKSDRMHEKINAVLGGENFDLVQVEGIEMARYIPDPRFSPRCPPVIFDDHNAEYVLQQTAFKSDAQRLTRVHAALYSWIQWKKLGAYERVICAQSNHVIACSESDARALRTLMGVDEQDSPVTGARTRVSVIPNGVDTNHFVPSDEVCAKPLSELALVFTGKMDFRPNIDAMLWFCGEILPRLRNEIPLAHLTIVGQKPSPRIRALAAQSGIAVTGSVPDTRPYVADAAVYVVPLRMGSGTRLKVLEAMAMGKAIVATTQGIEGIDIEPGRDAVIADTPEEFAETIAALLRDPKRRSELGRAARALVESRYDWRTILPHFEQVYATVLEQTPAAQR